MATLYGGLLYLEETTSEVVKLLYFGVMMLANVSFFLLWSTMLLINFDKYG